MANKRNYRLYGDHTVAGLRLREIVYPPGYKEPFHDHPNPYFQYVVKGSYTEQETKREIDYDTFSLGFQPTGVFHTSRIHQEGLHCFTIHLGATWDERLQNRAAAFEHATCFRGGPLPWLGMRLFNEFQNLDAVSPLIIEGLTLEMLGELIRQDQNVCRHPAPRWLRNVADLLHSRFSETVTLDEIARLADVHPVYLSRAFRKQYDCTIGEYIRRLRIDFACRTLLNSEMPLAEIALCAGFADQSHFTKVFKRLMGVSPAAFRNQGNRVCP